MAARHVSKGGLGFAVCFGCLNYRPLCWSIGGWGGPWFCRACASRCGSTGKAGGREDWVAWAEANRAYLASIGWRGRLGRGK